ncbi:hypothetical protein SPRG_06551 [Saprolegnia parasitica CBS 223.65]|uniref:Uncharacterized protein n=1 Tax=Saprolegnia parasitica (strain CBS 223.65) TaxID=695850 RepID=A0A067CPJ4_SAPPC|nr:hypothetical protein SPRG_06551 [Saprolegnia parasitica CBS 223.65]KDO28697.1 hypothetical protein SPRG_06551 [Saprolegnia parasitica CBS 223.65]|eukprot:XP_012200755.1 hypothetical protein SPRG_06551 [Saprolegnia parasitica CBS 223.65]
MDHLDFLDLCADGDFLSRGPRQDFRKELRGFRDLLWDNAWAGFGVYRKSMETIVHIVVDDAVGGGVASFDAALRHIDRLGSHLSSIDAKAGSTYLRTFRWGMTGFQVFKNMDTHGKPSADLPDHAPLLESIKAEWITIAGIQMKSIVTCFEWLHGALGQLDGKTETRAPVRHYAPRATQVVSPEREPSPSPSPSPTRIESKPLGVQTTASYDEGGTARTSLVTRAEPSRVSSNYVAPAPYQAPPPLKTVVMDKPLQDLVKMVLVELQDRYRASLRPRFYQQCTRAAFCKIPGCNYWHSDEDRVLVGVTRAIMMRGVWKTTYCKYGAECPYIQACNHLHDHDGREIDQMKSLAHRLVERILEKATGEVEVHFVNGKKVKVLT